MANLNLRVLLICIGLGSMVIFVFIVGLNTPTDDAFRPESKIGSIKPPQPGAQLKIEGRSDDGAIHGEEASEGKKSTGAGVRDRIKRASRDRWPDLKEIAKLHALWGEMWVDSFNVPLESASNGEVASGKIVPQEVIELMSDLRPVAHLLENDQLAYAFDQTEKESAYGMAIIAIAVCGEGGAGLPAFLNRIDLIPPTRGDVAVFKALSDGLMVLEKPRVLNGNQYAGWKRILSAKNAVYRLIAARAFNLVSSDLAQCSDFYRELLNDTDRTIAGIAVKGAVRYATPETVAALKSFQKRQSELGNEVLANAATKALAGLSNELSQNVKKEGKH